MSVYIDSANIKYRNMIMCHIIADTDDEFGLFINKIGVNIKHWQFKGTRKSHFDICLFKKKLALKFGAIEVSSKELINIIKLKN